ncbi:hypothetical protein [Mycobacterium tuberculosis]|uniref:hypothetical protein n=1 Tax=Mycobacterium tuberculosis TaxID=1773 RepID=UPI00272D6532|nr:hypothetical protein [Mycobacterium tuberculosis]
MGSFASFKVWQGESELTLTLRPEMTQHHGFAHGAIVGLMVAVARSGFSAWLDVEPVKVWQGESELTLTLRPEMTQHHGFAHGAIVGLMGHASI